MYKLISLGFNCTIAYWLRKKYNNQKTHFFDWLMSTHLKEVNLFLTNDPDTILDPNNLELSPTNESDDTKYTVFFNWLNRLESRHDVLKTTDQPNMEYFCKKYKRRYLRLMRDIKTKKIAFIHFVDNTENTTVQDFDNFFENLHKIHLTNNHRLIIIVRSTKDFDYFANMKMKNKRRIILFNFSNYPKNIGEKVEFPFNNLKWDAFFAFLEKKLSTIIEGSNSVKLENPPKLSVRMTFHSNSSDVPSTEFAPVSTLFLRT